jgi:hypothetical protein
VTEPKPRPRKRTPRPRPLGTVEIDTTPRVGKNPPIVPLGVVAPVEIDLDIPLLGKNPPKTYRLRRPLDEA